MDLFEYIERMKALGGPVATVAVVMLCLFLVFIIIKMLGGMRRGTWKQLFRSGTTLAAAIISYSVAVMLSNSIMGSTSSGSIEEFIALMDGYFPGIGEILTQALSTFNTEVFEYVIILPAAIVLMPMLAAAIFLLINLILQIVRNILIKVFGFKATKSNSQRLGGALLGGIEAIIWVIIVTLPITGIIGIADRACDRALESGTENSDLEAAYNEFILPFTENPAYTFIDALGSGALSDGIATIEINEVKTNLRDELLYLAQIGMVEIPALEGADFAALSESNKASLDNITDALHHSPFVSSVIAGVIQSSSGFMNSDLIPFDKAGEYGGLFASLLDFLEGVTQGTLAQDINTIMSVYYAISDSGVIKELEESEGADLMALLQDKRREGDDTIPKIIGILQDNPRTAAMVKAMTETLLSSLSTGVQLPNGSTVSVSYDSLKNDMSNVLSVERSDYATDDEYYGAIGAVLDSTLRENGIALEGEIIDSIAEYIGDEYSDIDEMTDAQFNDMLLYYYDAYLEYVN